MATINENILKAAKEIVVKFIECGRLSPSGFAETFQSIYRTVEDTVKRSIKPVETPPAHGPEPKAPASGPKASSARR